MVIGVWAVAVGGARRGASGTFNPLRKIPHRRGASRARAGTRPPGRRLPAMFADGKAGAGIASIGDEHQPVAGAARGTPMTNPTTVNGPVAFLAFDEIGRASCRERV